MCIRDRVIYLHIFCAREPAYTCACCHGKPAHIYIQRCTDGEHSRRLCMFCASSPWHRYTFRVLRKAVHAVCIQRGRTYRGAVHAHRAHGRRGARTQSTRTPRCTHTEHTDMYAAVQRGRTYRGEKPRHLIHMYNNNTPFGRVQARQIGMSGAGHTEARSHDI